MKQTILSCLAYFTVAFSTFAQWQPQLVQTDASFRAVSVASPDIAWIGGTKGTFVRTTDGGKTWQTGTVSDAQACDFRDVQAVDEQTAYLMSAGPAEKGQARIYKTTNGGQTWSLLYQTQQQGVFFDGIDFWDKQHGIVLSDPIDGKWFILTTDDGGQTWKQVPAGNLPPMQPNEAAFAASGTSLIVQGKRDAWIVSGGGTNGRVFHSKDRGQTWTVTNTPLPAGEATGLFGARFFSEKAGVVVGGNYKQEQQPGPNAAITRDGGQSWQLLAPTNPPGLKEAVALIPGDRLLAVGPSGTSLSADQGQTWQKLDNDGFHSLACAKGTCYAVGAKGKIAVQRFK
ncbi:WD40/YVTN/BNR-like repeat-containing protein [Spirosoma oryzicola]|uniref:WD40/YVTN/BNR-like repeat-containing protein n=1 Tax=Spirosoma oryzicola TaxID=2898794 RepID=UPI001E545310|nr:oxidoreductase [Spirosoma oryzicola]UHG90893.1 oxidoreductase [Spirosoma oryzicola]